MKKGTFGGLAGVALSRGRDIPGHWKNIVLNIVSFSPLNYPPSVLAVLLVIVLVVVLLSDGALGLDRCHWRGGHNNQLKAGFSDMI